MAEKLIAITVMILLVFAACSANAQQTTTTATTTTTAAAPAAPAAPPSFSDLESSREQLREVLHSLPPEVGRVLKLDMSLWTNQSYLNNYPQLAAFVAQHPEVARNPQYYTRGLWIPTDEAPQETAGVRMWRDMMEGFFVLCGIGITVFVFTWVIRKVVEHRRWTRLSRVQAEVHNKLLDRFGSNEDVLRYIQTAAGRKFLEAAPIPLEAAPQSVAAPIGRVLWSVQAGVILGAAGLGLQAVSFRADKDVASALSALGVLAIAIGAGFIVSAALSWFLSRKLGILQPPPQQPETVSE